MPDDDDDAGGGGDPPSSDDEGGGDKPLAIENGEAAEGGEKKEEGGKKKGRFGGFGRFGKKKKGGEEEEGKEEDGEKKGSGSDEDANADESPSDDESLSESEPSESEEESEPEILTKAMQKEKFEKMEEELERRDKEKEFQILQAQLMAVEDDLSWAYAQNYNTYLRMIKNYHAELAQKEEVAARERFQLKLARTEGFEYKNRRLLHFETWKQSPSIHHNFKGHAAAVNYVRISDDWHRILSCSSDKTMKLWDRISSECLRTFEGHFKGVRSCDMPRDYGKHMDRKHAKLLSCGWDRTIRIWDADTGFEMQCLPLFDSVYQVMWGDETCRHVFAAMESGVINVYDGDTVRPNRPTECTLLYTYKGGHDCPVAGITLSPSGRYLMSWGSYGDPKMCLWLAHTGRRRLPRAPESGAADQDLDKLVCERCGKLCTAHELIKDEDVAYDPVSAADDELPPEPPPMKKKLFMAFGVAIEMTVPMESSEVDWSTVSEVMDPFQCRRGKLHIEAKMDPNYPEYVEQEEVDCRGYMRAGPTKEKAKEEAKKARSEAMRKLAEERASKGARHRGKKKAGEADASSQVPAAAVAAVAAAPAADANAALEAKGSPKGSPKGGGKDGAEDKGKDGNKKAEPDSSDKGKPGKKGKKKGRAKKRRVRKKKKNPLSRDAMLDAVGGPGTTLYEPPDEAHDDAIPTRALYAWVPERDDELAFEAGDIVMVDKKDDETGIVGWWLGHLKGKTRKKDRGLFPYNFVMVENLDRIEEEEALDLDDPEVLARLRRERREKVQKERQLEKKMGKELWAQAQAEWELRKREHDQRYDVQQMRLQEMMLVMEEECYRQLLRQRQAEEAEHQKKRALRKGGEEAAAIQAQEERMLALKGEQKEESDIVAKMQKRVDEMLKTMAAMATPEQLYHRYAAIEHKRTGIHPGPPLQPYGQSVGDVAEEILQHEEDLARRALHRRRPEYLDMPGLLGDDYIKTDAVGVFRKDKMLLRRGARGELQGFVHRPDEEVDWRRVEAQVAEENDGLVYTFNYKKDGERIYGHDGWVNRCVFSRDETRVASAGSDGLAKVWDPMGGRLMTTIDAHDDAVTSVAFSRDGKNLVTASADRQIMLWRLLDSKRLATIQGHSDVITAVQFIRDDVGILSCSLDTTVKTWQIVPTVPDAPARPTCSNVGMRELVIHWEPPLCYNAEITNYIIVRRIGIRQKYHQPLLVGQVTYTRITDLLPGRAYQFKIAAINAVGQGHYSPPSPQTIMDSTVPDTISPRPKICSHEAAVGAYSLALTWNAPDAMGSPIQEFKIDIRGGLWGTWGTSPDLVVSWNSCADMAEMVAQAQEDAKKAEKATISTFQKHIHKIEAKIRRRENKLMGIDHLKTQEEQDEENTTTKLEGFDEASALPMVWEVHGLKPGYMYQFRVKAVNALGEGEWSMPSVSHYTACLPPMPPTQPSVDQVAMHSMRVHWTIPDIRGSPISQYLVKVLPTQVVHKVSYNKIDYTVLDLEPGESYCFQVAAANRVGCSEFSKPTRLMMTKKGVPGIVPPPESFGLTPVSMELKWQPATIINGAPLTHYVIQQREGDDDEYIKEFVMDINRIDVLDESMKQKSAAKKRSSVVQGSEGGEKGKAKEGGEEEKEGSRKKSSSRKRSSLKGGKVGEGDEAEGEGATDESEDEEEEEDPMNFWYTRKMRRLFAGAFYDYRVCAVNMIGRGPWSAWSEPRSTEQALPPPPPKKLAVPAAEMTFKSCSLVWQLGVSKYASRDNGAPLKRFEVQMDVDESGIWGPAGGDEVDDLEELLGGGGGGGGGRRSSGGSQLPAVGRGSGSPSSRGSTPATPGGAFTEFAYDEEQLITAGKKLCFKVELAGLQSGVLYRCRARTCNRRGASKWSRPSDTFELPDRDEYLAMMKEREEEEEELLGDTAQF